MNTGIRFLWNKTNIQCERWFNIEHVEGIIGALDRNAHSQAILRQRSPDAVPYSFLIAASDLLTRPTSYHASTIFMLFSLKNKLSVHGTAVRLP